MKNQNSALARFLLGSCAFIIVMVPFHALFTAWLASTFGHFDLIRLWKEFLLACLFGAAVIALLRDKKLQRELRKDKGLQFIGLYLTLIVAMTLVGAITGKVNFGAAAYGLVIDARLFVFMFVAWIAAKKAGPVRNWPLWVLLPAAVVVLFGLLQLTVLPRDFLRHFGYGPATLPVYQTVDNRPGLARLQSTLRGPNPLGAYLVAVIIIAVAYMRRCLPRFRLGVYVAVIFALVTLFATYSRSAYAGLLIACVVLGYLSLKGAKERRFFAIVAVMLILVGTASVLIHRNNDTVQNIVFHSSEKSSSATSSNFLRTAALKQGVNDIVHNPFGGGVGSAGPASLRNTKSPARISENFFLQIGQEAGLLGLGLFIAILYVLAQKLWTQRNNDMSRALLAMLIGLIAVNMVSHAWADDTLAYVFFGALGLHIGSVKAVQKAKKRATL